MRHPFFARCIAIVVSACVITVGTSAEEVLLEDYQYGGCFAPADWANTFSDGKGNQNATKSAKGVAVVDWATQWSGLPSNGEIQDFSKFKTFQADVRVAEGEPVESGSNFYFQLLNESAQGYSYWEAFVPQEKVPADGKWYRVRFPLARMAKGFGDGGEAPADFTTIAGTCCGMTFDETENDLYQPKQAHFDNLVLSDEEVDGIKVVAVNRSSAETIK